MKSKFVCFAAASILLISGAVLAQNQGEELFPPNAKPGECFTRVFVAPTYNTVTEQVLVKEAATRLEIVPARYETVKETVLVEEASTKLEVVPAQYSWVEEKVLVKPESKRLVEVPAVYETVTEQILVKPAHTVWKEGRGPVERVDNSTGEIMCLIEVPAEYKTVTKRVLKTSARSEERVIPAEYKTVKKRVVTSPPTTRTVEIPAKYKTLTVTKLVKPSAAREIAIPEEHRTVTRREKVTEGRMAWNQILCETNTTADVVLKLQRALNAAGHNPGNIDGVLGPDTMRAVQRYQSSKGMPGGGLTVETLKSLEVL